MQDSLIFINDGPHGVYSLTQQLAEHVKKLQEDNEKLRLELENIKKNVLVCDTNTDDINEPLDCETKHQVVTQNTDVSLWLREKYELALSFIKLIKKLVVDNNIDGEIIEPSIYGSFLTILFMNAFGIKANVDSSDLDITLDEVCPADLDIKSKIIDFMKSTLLENFKQRFIIGSDALIFGQYILNDVQFINIDLKEQKSDYFDVPLLKLTMKHKQTHKLFNIDISGWSVDYRLDVNAKGFRMDWNGLDHKLEGHTLLDTIYRISKGETVITKNLKDLQQSHLSSDPCMSIMQCSCHIGCHHYDPFKRLTHMLTSRLPKTISLGLKIVGQFVPYVKLDSKTILTRIICDCGDGWLEENVVSSLLKLKTRTKCKTCLTVYKLDLTNVNYTCELVHTYELPIKDKMIIHLRNDGSVRAEPVSTQIDNMFVDNETKYHIEQLLK